MIQIPLTADLHIERGGTPTLEFRDRKEFEDFIFNLQKQLEIIQGKRKQRIEYFSDGIYFDGKLLEIRGRHFAILKAFEHTDQLSRIDLICKVWGNSLVNEKTVASTISHFNRTMIDTGIFISLSDGYYTIYRPQSPEPEPAINARQNWLLLRADSGRLEAHTGDEAGDGAISIRLNWLTIHGNLIRSQLIPPEPEPAINARQNWLLLRADSGRLEAHTGDEAGDGAISIRLNWLTIHGNLIRSQLIPPEPEPAIFCYSKTIL